MRVLLLGGTGAIGENLVNILNEHSVETKVTTRKNRENHGTICYVKGNAHEKEFLREVCKERWDAVVDFMSYKTDEFESRIDLLLSCTDQYVFISSARVYADKEHPIKESSPRLLDVCNDREYLSTDEYALTKARQEDIIKSHSSNKNYTIVRPYITYSDKRLQLGVLEKEEWLFRAIRGHTIIFAEEIANRTTTMTNGRDVALGIYNLIGQHKAYGETFHLTSEHLRTWKEILQIYSSTFKSVTGKELKVKMVPLDVFIKCRNRGLEYQVIYDRVFDRDFDTSKESIYANSGVFIEPELGLEECLTKFLVSGYQFNPISYGNEARKDRITGESFTISTIPNIKQKIHYFINRYIL